MIHILHNQTDEIVGWISKVIEDTHTQTIKNEDSFDFHVHTDEPYADRISKRTRLLIPAEEGDYQEFIVNKIYDSTRSKIKEVYSKGSYFDLKKAKIIKPQTLDGQTLHTSAGMVLSGLKWQLGVVESVAVHKWVIEKHIDAYNALQTLATLFECELRFRVTTDGHEITGRYVDFLIKQGQDRGKETTFGKDLIDIKRTVYPERIVTALYCLGPEREDGSRPEVTVTNDDAFQNWNWHGQHLIEIYEPESSDQDLTEERLTQLGETELNKRIDAAVEYEIEAASLEHIFGYEHEIVRLGDTNKIKDEHFNPPMYLGSRVISVSRSIFDKSKKTFKLGEVIEYKKEDVMKTWKELQDLYGTKVIKSPTAPPGRKNTIWIKTGGSVEIVHTWDSGLNKWIPTGGSYTWMRYADDENGTNMSESPSGKSYIGFSYNRTEQTPSNDPTEYIWSLFVGPQGVQGPSGSDGQPTYTWIRFADDVNGNGMSDNPTGKLYIGLAPNKTNQTESNNPADYTWALFKGEKGEEGPQGPQGEVGPQGPAGTNAIMGVLSNDTHAIPTDSAGNNGNFTGASTKASVFIGAIDDSANWTATASPSSGVTGSLSGKTYTVTAMTVDTGYVDITLSRPGYASIVKRFTLSKVKQGSTGATGGSGANATAYWLVTDVSAIQKSIAGVYTPANLSITAKSQTGTGLPTNYSGRFIIAETTDGTTWTDKYTSSVDEATKAWTPTAGIRAVRVRLYVAGGTSTLLDEEIVPVVSDGATGAQGPQGEQGSPAVSYNWVTDGGVAIDRQGNLGKPTGSNGWNAQAYTKESFIGGAFLSFKAGILGVASMIGLNSDPTTNNSFTSIDYAIYLEGANFHIYESGTNVGLTAKAYAVGDSFQITYDNAKVRYYHNGTLIREVSATANTKFYVDTSFNTVRTTGNYITDIFFGPSGAKGEIGPQGVQGPKGADGQPTYTWVRFADDDQGNGMSQYPDGKRYLGLAPNKTSEVESDTPSDYMWSPLYDNVVVGGANILSDTNFMDLQNKWFISQVANTWKLLTTQFQTEGNILECDRSSLPYNVNNYVDLRQTIPGNSLELNVPYTISFYLYMPAIGNVTNNFKWYLTNITGTSSDNNWTPATTANSSWLKFSKTIIFTAKPNNNDPVMYFRVWDGTRAMISKIKFEKGNVPTEWEKEDVVGGVNLISSKSLTSSSGATTTANMTLRGWAVELINSANTLKMLTEGKTYTLSYDVEMIAKSLDPTLNQRQAGLYLYSPATTNDIYFWSTPLVNVGDRARVVKTFICPPMTDQRILYYTNRYTTTGSEPADYDTIRITNLKLEVGNVATPYSAAEDDNVQVTQLYNGVQIDSTNGFMATRSDSLVRTIANATGGFKIQRRATTSASWVDLFYVDTNGKLFVIDAEVAGKLKAVGSTSSIELANDELRATYGTTTRRLFGVSDTLPILYDGNLANPAYTGFGKIYTKTLSVYVPAGTYTPGGAGGYLETTITIPLNDQVAINKISSLQVDSKAREFYAYEKENTRVFDAAGDFKSFVLRISPHYQVTVSAFYVSVELEIIGSR